MNKELDFPIETRIFFDGGEIQKKEGWRGNWYGTVTSHDHPHDNIVFVRPDNETCSIPMSIYEIIKIK